MRGFIPRCGIDETGAIFELHVKDPCAAGVTLELQPFFHEMPDVAPFVVKVLSSGEAFSEKTRFNVLNVQLVEENDFVTRFLLAKEVLESPVDPGDITRG
jgi:hypothetical protein